MYVGDGDIIHSSRERGKSVVEAMDAIADYRIVGYGRVRGADDPHVAVTVPHMRLDLRIAEDFIEEIGRVYGYDRVPSRDPHALRAPVVLSVYYIANAARRVLDTAGYAEVYTSSFRSAGEWEVLYPAASDKNFLRTDLATAMEDRLAFNARNMDLFGTERIAVYEIGSVFTEGTGERTLLSIGVAYPRMKEGKARESAKKDIADVCVGYAAKLGIAEVPMLTEKEVERGYVVEIDIGALAGEAPIPPDYGDTLDTPDDVPAYKSFSPYPYMTRDIAFWTPEGTSVDDARVAVEGEGLPLAIRTDLFDTFAKDGRVSYAFRIVFQAPDRTLTDEEVNGIMDSVYARVAARGWEGR
jgi:phenylalanyl-tRNA synthetase beta chain